MKKSTILFILLFLIACGGAEAAPTPTATAEPTPTAVPPTDTPVPTNTPEPTATPPPTLSPTFLNRLDTFLNDASTLAAATEQGVNFRDFNSLLTAAAGSFSLVEETWPESLDDAPLRDFNNAFTGWSLTLDLWNLKIGDFDNPLEPDINGYLNYVEYAGDDLITDVHPNGYIVQEYRGKTFLPFDENIGVLMALAGEDFQAGRTAVLQATE